MATASDLIAIAAGLLNDPRFEAWSATELVSYLNAGYQLLAQRVPSQFPKLQTLDLVAGTQQTLPATGIMLFDVRRNVNGDGTSGRAPRYVLKPNLTQFSPNWHAATAGVTREWMYDVKNPKIFAVSPPATAGAKLEIEFAEQPSDLIINSVVQCDKAFHSALTSYVCARALSKDAEYGAADGRAAVFLKQFDEATGGNPPKSG